MLLDEDEEDNMCAASSFLDREVTGIKVEATSGPLSFLPFSSQLCVGLLSMPVPLEGTAA